MIEAVWEFPFLTALLCSGYTQAKLSQSNKSNSG